MRKLSIAMLVIGLAQAPALGGIITFVPDNPTVDVGAGDSPLVKFDVFVGSLVGVDDAFTSIDILFGSNDLDLVSFEFDQSILDLVSFSSTNDFPGLGFYSTGEITAGAFAIFPISVTGPVRLGSLTVDITGLPLGKYEVIVDGSNDGGRSAVVIGGNSDLLFGTGSVSVVPEPATISLLGIASLALIHRRRTGWTGF